MVEGEDITINTKIITIDVKNAFSVRTWATSSQSRSKGINSPKYGLNFLRFEIQELFEKSTLPKAKKHPYLDGDFMCPK